jgi:hypothetical protein
MLNKETYDLIVKLINDQLAPLEKSRHASSKRINRMTDDYQSALKEYTELSDAVNTIQGRRKTDREGIEILKNLVLEPKKRILNLKKYELNYLVKEAVDKKRYGGKLRTAIRSLKPLVVN